MTHEDLVRIDQYLCGLHDRMRDLEADGCTDNDCYRRLRAEMVRAEERWILGGVT